MMGDDGAFVDDASDRIVRTVVDPPAGPR